MDIRNQEGYMDSTPYEALKDTDCIKVQRGDIFYLRKRDSETGQETQGRPALIVSNDKINETSNYVEVVYLKEQNDKRLYPTQANVLCRVPCVAICEQIDYVHKNKLGEYARSCTSEEMFDVDKALRISLFGNVEETVVDSTLYESLQADLSKAEKENEQLRNELKSATAVDETMNRVLQEALDEANKLTAELEKSKRELDIAQSNIVRLQDIHEEIVKQRDEALQKVREMTAGERWLQETTEHALRMEIERNVYEKLYKELLVKMM